MLFVTKCPCDECVPLIKGAGVTHIYTTDQDRDKDKEDISYLMFSSLRNVNKFIVSAAYWWGSSQSANTLLLYLCIMYSVFLCLHLYTNICKLFLIMHKCEFLCHLLLLTFAHSCVSKVAEKPLAILAVLSPPHE